MYVYIVYVYVVVSPLNSVEPLPKGSKNKFLEPLGRDSTLFSGSHNYIHIYNIYKYIFIFRPPMDRTPIGSE